MLTPRTIDIIAVAANAERPSEANSLRFLQFLLVLLSNNANLV